MHSVHDTYPMAYQSCGEKLGKPDSASSGKLKKFSSTPAALEMQHSAKRKHPTSPGGDHSKRVQRLKWSGHGVKIVVLVAISA
eukprot:4411461-Amphidinium_carterae.1